MVTLLGVRALDLRSAALEQPARQAAGPRGGVIRRGLARARRSRCSAHRPLDHVRSMRNWLIVLASRDPGTLTLAAGQSLVMTSRHHVAGFMLTCMPMAL